jgi:hypothetical protein
MANNMNLVLVSLIQQLVDDDLKVVIVSHQNTMITEIMTTLVQRRNKVPRMLNYVETIIPNYTNEEFRKRNRMNRESFNSLLQDLMPYKENSIMPMEKQVLIFIKYLYSQMPFQSIADNYGVCEFTVFNIVKRLSDVVCAHLLEKYIKWPEAQKVQEPVQGFMNLKGFPGVLGAIDGIPIKTPVVCTENYINRKSFASINIQAACDSKMHFLDIFVGWPGSVHESRVLKNSPLFDKIENNQAVMFPNNTHLLGDSAYGLFTWLLTPFKDYGNLTQKQRRYNYVHSSTRVATKRTFGALKGRFRCLKYLDIKDITKAVKVVSSCCVLHELCLTTNDSMEEYIEEDFEDEEEVNNFFEMRNLPAAAALKRQMIVDTL